MPIITVLSATPITEHYREYVIEDRFYRRINEHNSGLVISGAVLETDAQVIARGKAENGVPERAEYEVYQRQVDSDVGHVSAIVAFDRETEETINVVTLKIPLGDLPANFDSLPTAEKNALAIEWGRNVARTVNFATY